MPICSCEERRRERGPKGSREVSKVGYRRHFMWCSIPRQNTKAEKARYPGVGIKKFIHQNYEYYFRAKHKFLSFFLFFFFFFCLRMISSCLQNASLALSCSSFIAMDFGSVGGLSSQNFSTFLANISILAWKKTEDFQAFICVGTKISLL